MMHHHSEIHELSYFTLKQTFAPFFWIDEKGTIQHVNRAAELLSGYQYDDIVGKKYMISIRMKMNRPGKKPGKTFRIKRH